MLVPRIVIAGTNSGCGKTTITSGIMAALVKRGLRVQPFKVGPDYIDPMFHTFVTGNESRNLDSWMLGEDIAAYLFNKAAAGSDISIVEGVMGFFDGYGGYSQEGSTSHVSKIIKAPVLLIVNGEGLSLSIAAIVKGFMDFDREALIRGVILNNVNSEHNFRLLKEIIEEQTGLAVLGYVPKIKDCTMASRHLGLVQSSEIADLRDKINMLAFQIEKTVNLDLLLKIANEAEKTNDSSVHFNIARRSPGCRIAVARDKAFSFYYRDGLDLLEMLGAELVEFSPLKDVSLPCNVDGLYIGGGYPEIFAGELQDNLPMREKIKKAIEEGIPAYAECGGFMYLCESIRSRDGEVFGMVGAIPGKSEMTSSLQRFGYVELEVTNDNALAKKGYRALAHEFHYSVTAVDWQIPACFKVIKRRRGKENRTWQCGYKINNLLAGYPHLHLWSNTGFAERFVNSCIQYRARK
ncbi:MAG: cobyrinate a,c-diamide synthase [Clostridia bacterium]|nr:cobyrinate a,c-diamide synthase [Clostridia bacterium]